MHPSNRMGRTRQRYLAMPLIVLALWTGAGCGEGDKGSVSSDQLERDAKVVFRADLKPGSTGETAANIVRRFADVEGVWGTRGDDGKHVWIYGVTDATPEQIDAMEQRLRRVPSVTAVRQLR